MVKVVILSELQQISSYISKQQTYFQIYRTLVFCYIKTNDRTMSNCNVFTFYMETSNASFPTFSKTTNNFHESVIVRVSENRACASGFTISNGSIFLRCSNTINFYLFIYFCFRSKKIKFLWKVVPDCT